MHGCGVEVSCPETCCRQVVPDNGSCRVVPMFSTLMVAVPEGMFRALSVTLGEPDKPPAVPVVFWFSTGTSAATIVRKNGVPVEPFGAAKNVLAVSLANPRLILPDVVMGLFPIVKIDPVWVIPTLTTLPPPPPPPLPPRLT